MFNEKKKYFKNKLKAVIRMTWDLDFKRFKTLEIREEIRMEYDNRRAKMEGLLKQIEDEKAKPTMSKDEFSRLEDQQVLMQREIERSKAQIDGIDVEVNGARKSNEYPDGVDGMAQQLEALHELQTMIKDYIKGL